MENSKEQVSKRCKKEASLPCFDLKKIKVISFDLDDTLWHCEPVIRKAELEMQNFLQEIGKEVMRKEVTRPNLDLHEKRARQNFPSKIYDVTFMRRKALEYAAKTCKIDLTDEIVDQAFQKFYTARTSHVSEHIFPGVIEALERLKTLGLRLGTISNGNAQVFKIPEIAPFIEHHVNPEIAGSAKPLERVPILRPSCLKRSKASITPGKI